MKNVSWQEMALCLLVASIGVLFGRLSTRRPSTSQCQVAQRRLSFRIISHNIRYAATELERGEAAWSLRLPLLVAHFRYHTAQASDAIICMQEVLHHQLTDLRHRLNAKVSGASKLDWNVIGIGRDDGKQAGEYAPIWYRPAVWELKQWDTVWLSPTPMKPGWGAGSNRIVTIALFEHRLSRQEVVVMNTHLDEQSSLARRNAAEILDDLVQKWSQPHDSQQLSWQRTPVLLAGDLNSEATGEAYEILNNVMQDSQENCESKLHYGEHFTYTGFNESEQQQRLDYIFVGPRSALPQQSIRTLNTAILPNRFEIGELQHMFHSDHRAVTADIELEL